jgi:hypothetical protein
VGHRTLLEEAEEGKFFNPPDLELDLSTVYPNDCSVEYLKLMRAQPRMQLDGIERIVSKNSLVVLKDSLGQNLQLRKVRYSCA